MINENFRIYLEEAIGHENALVAFSAFERPASVSIRMNPFKQCRQIQGREVPWCRYGHILEERPVFTLDPSFHAGAYYVQDSSSMFVGHAFREILGKRPPVAGRRIRVLDLCAAPGGKTTDLAASLRELYGDDYVSEETSDLQTQDKTGTTRSWKKEDVENGLKQKNSR